jgi:hypothetical protein
MSFQSVGLTLSRDQKASLAQGKTIKLTHAKLSGPDTVIVNKRVYNAIQKAKASGVGTTLQLSQAALRKNRKGAGVKDFLKEQAANVAPDALKWAGEQGGKALGSLLGNLIQKKLRGPQQGNGFKQIGEL